MTNTEMTLDELERLDGYYTAFIERHDKHDVHIPEEDIKLLKSFRKSVRTKIKKLKEEGS